MQQGNLGWGVPDVSSNSLLIRYHSVSTGAVSQSLLPFPPFLFSPLHYTAKGFDSHRESDLLNTALFHGSFRVKIQMSGSGHYPLLSNFYRRLAVQFCSSAAFNPKERSLGSEATALACPKCAVIFRTSCLKVIRACLGKNPNKPVYEHIVERTALGWAVIHSWERD